jgi:hydroxymethylglutaryl-CoA lyase
MALPGSVRLVEVGPRDGLQNEPAVVGARHKVELIDRLGAAGLRTIEVGSFVSPKWVPQMADTAEVLALLRRRPGVSYPVLVPNLRGLEAALDHGVEEIAVFAAASESFSRKNINCSIDESLDRFAPVTTLALERGLKVRGYISCVLGCPYEGRIQPAAVSRVAARLSDMGCYEISLGDTIGVGTPGAAQRMIAAVAERVPIARLAAHFHDTWGQGLANIYASLELGISVVDSSVGGLGGCPYAKGATGNVATEDVLYMLDGLGIATGVDLAGVVAAAAFIGEVIGRPPVSRVARAFQARTATAAAQGLHDGRGGDPVGLR